MAFVGLVVVRRQDVVEVAPAPGFTNHAAEQRRLLDQLGSRVGWGVQTCLGTAGRLSALAEEVLFDIELGCGRHPGGFSPERDQVYRETVGVLALRPAPWQPRTSAVKAIDAHLLDALLGQERGPIDEHEGESAIEASKGELRSRHLELDA